VSQLHPTVHQNNATDHTSEIVYVLSELKESTPLSFKKVKAAAAFSGKKSTLNLG
jgi:hypothetical protein